MILDLENPASIAAWYRADPERRGPMLAQFAKNCPQYADVIRAAGKLLREKK